MSATAPPEDDLYGQVPAKSPWRKVAFIAGGVIIVVLLWIAFSNRNIIMRQTEKPIPIQDLHLAPATGQVGLPPHDKPNLPAPTASPIASKIGGPVVDEERQKALQSNIVAYTITASAATAGPVVKATNANSNDPDALPINAQPDALEASLTPTKIVGTRVAELPNPTFLVEQGRILQCIQVTRINSTLPGSVTAIIPGPIRGETGDVILIPSGARVFGTVQHGLMNGLDRLGVLWQNITTPVLYDPEGRARQFRVEVNSPASSDMGETGLDGDVNHHYLKKIGGIIGMSFIQGAIQSAENLTQKQGNGGNSTINFNQFGQGGSNAADALLRAWVNIPDVMTRDQGQPCGIELVRDLDMRGVYRFIRENNLRAK